MSNNLFVPYHDIVNDIYYIDRDSYELCKSYQIEVSGIPKIIKDRNYYSITKAQLSKLNEKTGNTMNEVKLIVGDDKKKPTRIKVCEYNDSMYMNSDILEKFINPVQRIEISINGKIYKKVYPQDLVEISRTSKSNGIKIEFDWKKIKPVNTDNNTKEEQQIKRSK